MPPTWKTLYKTVAIGTKIIAIDKRDWISSGEQKAAGILKDHSELAKNYWKMLGGKLVNVKSISPALSQNWEIGALSFLMTAFQMNGSTS